MMDIESPQKKQDIAAADVVEDQAEDREVAHIEDQVSEEIKSTCSVPWYYTLVALIVGGLLVSLLPVLQIRDGADAVCYLDTTAKRNEDWVSFYDKEEIVKADKADKAGEGDEGDKPVDPPVPDPVNTFDVETISFLKLLKKRGARTMMVKFVQYGSNEEKPSMWDPKTLPKNCVRVMNGEKVEKKDLFKEELPQKASGDHENAL